MGKNDNRVLWIDVLRGIAIFLVVFGHIGNGLDDFFIWTSPVKMPLFFAISGFLYNASTGIKIKHLFFRLGIPYCIFSFMPVLLIHSIYTGSALDYIVKFVFGWFIPTFFFTSLLFRIEVIYLKNLKYVLTSSIFIALLGYIIPETQWMKTCVFRTILISQLFMVIGYLWKKFFYTKKFQLNIPIFILNIALYSLLTFATYKYYPNQSIDVHLSNYYNVVVCFILIISGMYLIYLIIRCLEFYFLKYKPVKHTLGVLSIIGKYSIVIFLLQGPLSFVFSRTLAVVYPLDNKSWITSLVYSSLIVCISVIISIFIDKRYPKLLGFK